MPATSQAQFRFMEGVQHGSIHAKGLAPHKAAEFTSGVNYKSLPKRVKKAGVGAIVDDLWKAITTKPSPDNPVSDAARNFRHGSWINGEPYNTETAAVTAARDKVKDAVSNAGDEAAHLAGKAKKLIGLKDGGTVATVEPTKKGEKPIKFKEGGLHESLGVPAGKKIPADKAAEARSGKEGPLAQKQELFRENVLTGPKKAKDGFPSPVKSSKGKGSAIGKTPTGKSSYQLIKEGYGHGMGM